MQFGKSVATACSSFAVTNIDDLFVLVTFFAEASTNNNLTPLKITLGQYVGFTIIIVISLAGFGASLLIPSEPIGFLGLLPSLLGVWKLFGLVISTNEEDSEQHSIAGVKSIIKVSTITLMNGGDNIGTYIPLFSQAKGPEIAVYVVVYYVLLGVWCLVAYLVMKQKHVLSVAQRYARIVIPFLYMGLGSYIIIKSSCYPWSIDQINNSVLANPGKLAMALSTVFLLLPCMGAMVWFKLRKRRAAGNPPETDITLDNRLLVTQRSTDEIQEVTLPAESEIINPSHDKSKNTDRNKSTVTSVQ